MAPRLTGLPNPHPLPDTGRGALTSNDRVALKRVFQSATLNGFAINNDGTEESGMLFSRSLLGHPFPVSEIGGGIADLGCRVAATSVPNAVGKGTGV